MDEEEERRGRGGRKEEPKKQEPNNKKVDNKLNTNIKLHPFMHLKSPKRDSSKNDVQQSEDSQRFSKTLTTGNVVFP